MTTLTGTSETMSLSLLDALTALWKSESINLVAAAMRNALESVPDVRIISIAYALEVDDTRCLHVVLDVETDAGTKRLAFYRRAPGLSFTKGTWIPKRLLAVRVEVERSWIADAWLAQIGPVTAPTSAEPDAPAEMTSDSEMGNFQLSVVLACRWKPYQLTTVYHAIESAIQDRAILFGDPVSTGARVYVILKVFESNGWRRVFRYSPELDMVVRSFERCDHTEPDRAQPEATFDPTAINVRIPTALFLS